ncbi:MAG: L,D-transpeptidase family protein [Bacillota bacterium]|nr:L,D-transpeptidase family protein [Bacillota bacterium]
MIIIAVVVAVLLAAAGIATISYTHSEDYTSDILPEGININGVNCSGMDYDEAAKALTDEWNSKHLQVVGKLGETLEDFTDFGCKYDLSGPLSTVKSDNLIPAALNHYFHIPFDATIAMKVKSCSADFKVKVKNSEFLHREGVTETKDAYVDLSNPDFPIVPEVYGTKADPDAFMKDVLHAIAMGQFRFEYDESAYLSVPKVKQDDPELIDYQKFCKEYLNQKITYEFGDETFTLTAEELDGLMSRDYSGNADEEAVNDFVAKLKDKYDIAGGEVKFHSLTGKTFKVSRGDMIWVIDPEGEAAQLISDINSHKDVDRKPVYLQEGTGKYTKELYVGNTYIDVDLGIQHVNYFKNGKKVFDCDCVSGCVAAGHSTPTGVYKIGNKSRNITLKGGGKKGSKGYYESFVSYWMSFIGNSIGLHDASWRSTFGGEIYKYSGSHGCVNLPPKKAGELYEIIEIGDPVIVHF